MSTRAVIIFPLLVVFFLFTGFTKDIRKSNNANFKLVGKTDHKQYVISIYKNNTYKGSGLEVLYKTTCHDTKTKSEREFLIIKTNKELKTKMLAEFIMVEKLSSGENLTFPFGWETNQIELKDIRENCVIIIDNKIKPILG